MVKPAARRRLPASLALALAFIAASALSCDFLALALPQGAANAAFSYADPRIEKSVRVKDLDEPFGLAVAPDGRAFVIARSGVNEYDVELRLVQTYRADPGAGIDDRERDEGPEEWQVTTGPGTTVALIGTRSGNVLYLFPGGTILSRKFNESDFYSVLYNPADFNQMPTPHPLSAISAVANVSPNQALALSLDNSSLDLNLLVSTSSLIETDGKVRYELSFGSMGPYAGPYAFVPSVNFSSPAIDSSFNVQRLYALDDMVAIAVGSGSSIRDVDGMTFIFDRLTGGMPLASFATKSSISVASGDYLYQLSSEREDNPWLHRLRWLP